MTGAQAGNLYAGILPLGTKFFTELYEKGLVYKRLCGQLVPNDQTVLANEQVIDGCCWRCDTKVERKEIRSGLSKYCLR
ncbi:hypothetical protein ACLK1S_04050 [Escherichia coli]